MTNEIAEREDSTLELPPPAQAPSASARAMLHEHAQNMETAHQLAKAMVRTQMVPKRFYGKADDAAAAILYGAELGLNPIQSLQRVVPIHGMPTLEARTMVGLLKSRGFDFRTFEQSNQVVEIWAWEPTSPKVYGTDPDDEVNWGQRINPDAKSRWTIERAKLAGYVPTPAPGVTDPNPTRDDDWVTVTKTWDGKAKTSVVGNMKYITDPQTMLKAKAQAEVSRELAPDVLMGISYTREDLESEDQRQFDRADERSSTLARTQPVTVDEIFAEEVPIPDPEPQAAEPAPEPVPSSDPERDSGGDREATAEADHPAATADRSESQTPGSPANSAPDGGTASEPEPEQVKPPAKKAPTKKAAPREVSKLRPGLEKRLFTLLGDVGLADDKNRDGRIAVYRSVLDRDDITSTNDLDDVEVTKVGDQLYRWQSAGALDDEIAGILADAARDAEDTAQASAAAPTSEGSE